MSTQIAKGVDLKKVITFLEKFAPDSLSESWDNTGLLVEPMTGTVVKSILLTNDLTEDVVEEAVGIQANLIISYHPPIFKPLKKITKSNWKERIITSCLENKIAVYSPHTSWDSVPGGVNDWLAGAFDCAAVEPIIRQVNEVSLNAGAGRHCILKKKIKISEAVAAVKTLTSLKFLNLALAKGASLDTEIQCIAICAGSGSSVLSNSQADIYLTGEMSHHDILNAIHCNTSVIMCNHSNSERGFLQGFAKTLESTFSSNDLKVLISNKDRDPIQII